MSQTTIKFNRLFLIDFFHLFCIEQFRHVLMQLLNNLPIAASRDTNSLLTDLEQLVDSFDNWLKIAAYSCSIQMCDH